MDIHQHITPPSSFVDAPLTPPQTDEKTLPQAARDWSTCPYLTVKIKRDSLLEDIATAQVAAAGSLALYNLCRLHDEAEKASRNDIQSVGTEDLRHWVSRYPRQAKGNGGTGVLCPSYAVRIARMSLAFGN
jgi:hypothetical protein